MKTGPKAPYAIVTPSGIYYQRGRAEALAKARELLGLTQHAREEKLAKRFGVVIERTSEDHARRHGI